MAHAHQLKIAAQHPAVARVAPFAVFVALLGLASLLGRTGTLDPEDLRWLHLARGAAAALLLAYFWGKYVELRISRIPGREWLLAIAAGLVVFVLWIQLDRGWATLGGGGAGFDPTGPDGRIDPLLAVAAGLVVFVLWIQLDRGWATLGGGGAGFDPTGPDGRIDPLVAALRLASLALVVPVMEELFWRSFLMRWLDAPVFAFADPRRTSLRAFLIVAVLFALEHDQWLAGLFAGIVYNWLYVRTGRLWIPIAAHAVTNGALGIWILSTRSWHLW